MKPRLVHASRASAVALAGALTGVALAGCGEVTNTIHPNPATANHITVELSGQPNGFDVGLYEAQALGYFTQTNLGVNLRVPTAGQNPVGMVHAGQALVALSSEPTVLLHRNEDEPVVSVAAVVHVPLISIVISVPAAGPSGGNAVGARTGTTTTTTTTGTSPKTRTTARKTKPTATRTGSTTTATPPPTTTTTSPPTTTTITEQDATVWPAAMQQGLSQPRAPTYDGLVLVVRKDSIVQDAGLLRRFVQAVARGYRAARANPVAAVNNMITAVPSLAPTATLQLATVKAAIPHFFPRGLKVWGWQRQAQWNLLGTWMTNHGFLDNPNAATDASTNELLQGQGV